MVTRLSRVLGMFLLPILLLLALSPAGAMQNDAKRGRKYVPPPPMSRVEVSVLRATSGKPIPNAAVIFHPMQGEKDMGNMELKTTEEGKAVIDVITLGDTVRLQVIASGYQTFGEDYKIDSKEKQIVVRMKRPGEQYSVYKDHTRDGTQNAPAESPETKPAP